MAEDDLPDAPWAKGDTSELPDAPWAGGQNSEMSWGDVAKSAVTNIPGSAVEFGKSMAQPFLHPIDTFTNLKNVAQGAAEKAGLSPTTGHEKYAEALGQFISDRYGSMENFKKTLASDPVGVAADFSMITTGGGSALARAPGYIGRAGEIAAQAGRALDPVSNAARIAAPVARGAGRLAAEVSGGLTHTGAMPVETAARAGYEGGPAARAFQENLRDQAPMSEAVEDAQRAVSNMRAQRGAAYRNSMTGLSANQVIYPGIWADIQQAARRAGSVATFRGQSLSPSTQAIRQQIADAVYRWHQLPPAQFHTLEGFDALKRQIGDIRDSTQPRTPERRIADEMYNGVRNAIVRADPEYGRTMAAYEQASHQLREIEKTLSLPPDRRTGPVVDTALRKLQSTLRDNVNTSFGRRRELLQFLMDNGAPHLMEQLAGQAMKPWLPRGLGRLGMQLGAEMAALAAGAGLTGPHLLAAAPLAAAMSPRLTGEAAYYAGRAARLMERVSGALPPRTAYQAGRLHVTVTPDRHGEDQKPEFAERGYGGRAMADGGDPGDDMPDLDPAAQAEAARAAAMSRTRRAVAPPEGREESGATQAGLDMLIPGRGVVRSLMQGDTPGAIAEAAPYAVPGVGAALKAAAPAIKPMVRAGAGFLTGAGIGTGAAMMDEPAEAEEGLTKQQQELLRRTPRAQRPDLIKQFAAEGAATRAEQMRVAREKEEKAAADQAAHERLQAEIQTLPEEERAMYAGFTPEQRVQFWANKQEVKRREDERVAEEARAKAAAEAPFRERFPTLSKAMPAIAASAAAAIPYAIKLRQAYAANSYLKDWERTATAAEQALQANKLDEALPHVNKLKQYAAEHQKILDKIGHGPGVGTIAAASTIPFDLEFLTPNAIDAAVLPPGSPAQAKAVEQLTNPSEYAARAGSGIMQGLVPALTASKIPVPGRTVAPTAASIGHAETYATKFAQQEKAAKAAKAAETRRAKAAAAAPAAPATRRTKPRAATVAPAVPIPPVLNAPERASGGSVTDRTRAEAVLPAGHKLGMRVPRGGSRCGNCRFLASPTTCGNDGFIEWNGGPDLPAPKDEYCCDLYEHGRPGRAYGGRAMADGGDPGDDQAAAQEAAEAAAARVRAPYARANERVSGLPDVGTAIGNRLSSIVGRPYEALHGQLQVTDPETGMPTPEAMSAGMDVASMAMTGGMPFAQRGAAGMAGGRLTGTIGGEYGAAARTATRELPGRGELPGGPGVLQAPGGADLAHGAVSTEPLEGLPRKVAIPGQEPIEAGPHMPGRVTAHQYAQEAGLPYDPPKTYAKVDVPRAQRIAQAFDEMKHEPENPEVQRAYSKMIDETMAQWNAIKRTGLKVEFMPPGVDYYAASPRLATEDVRNNNHLWVFSTREGFGTDPATGHAYKPNVKENPLLAETGETISGQPALANDIFRIVHDYFGHIKEGVGFRADGEENAWRSHSAMYSPEARRAMTTETRGQNSWLNHGPHGEKNRTASTADTVFADQKIGLLPDWVVNEGAHDPVQAPAISQRRQLQPGSREFNKAAKQARDEIAAQGIGAGPLDLSSSAGVPNVPQEPLWRYEPARGVSPRLQEALENKNIARAINKSIGAGMELGADKWYHTEPIRRAFVAELGEDRGQQAFDQFMHLTAATSPRSDASTNIRNASYYYGKLRRGEPFDKRNPTPYGHIAQKQHRFHAQNILDAYRAHDLGAAARVTPWDLRENPKPASFAENLRGNLTPGTMDTHAFRNIGMRTGDPRFLITSMTEAFKGNPGPESMVRRFGEVNKPGIATYRPQQLVKEGRLTMEDALNYPTFWTAMPNPNEYAAAENLYRELGRKRGMPTADAQAAAWSGAGKLTGLESPATHTFPQLFNERVLFTAKMRGEDPMETLRKFIHGKEPLLSAGGAVAYRRSGGRVLSHYVDTNPSEAQKKAGNYRKAHISVHGLPIAIENPKGSSRYGVGKDGKPWHVTMPSHYGYIKGTVGHDKDHVDVYVGPYTKSGKAWVVDQHDDRTGKFDEHKVFVGFGSEEHVRRIYDAAFSDGRGKDRRRRIQETDIAGLKHWLSTMKPRAAA